MDCAGRVCTVNTHSHAIYPCAVQNKYTSPHLIIRIPIRT